MCERAVPLSHGSPGELREARREVIWERQTNSVQITTNGEPGTNV